MGLPKGTAIKKMSFHFANGEVYELDMNKYLMDAQPTGIFIKEEVRTISEQLVSPTKEYRIVDFIPMNALNYVHMGYED